jgi:hypothetical protein
MALDLTALPQHRDRALAELEVEIAQAERTRERWRLEATTAPTPRAGRRAKAMLHLAEERLEQLCQSRQVLL